MSSINLLEITKQSCTKQLILDASPKAVTTDFISFIDKNVKKYPGKAGIKFNLYEPIEDIKVSLYSLEKGFTMNDEMVDWLEENKDVEVQVASV